MRVNLRAAGAREQEAAAIVPQPLPTPSGEERYQAALDADPAYQRLVLAAIILAFIAGSGFGRLAQYGGWRLASLWCTAAATLAARCLTPRPAWRMRGAEPAAVASTVARLARLACIFALSALAAGRPGLATLVASAAGATLIWLAGRISSKGFNAALVMPWLAEAGWAYLAWADGRLGGRFAIVIAGLVALQWWGLRRTSFAPTVVTVALIHLGAAPALRAVLHEPLWAHLACAAVEFGLIAAAGYRHTLAALLRMPTATYRIAPLCLVPRLDRAWDHPVKINVA